MIKGGRLQTVIEEDWDREDGHPDFVYSHKRFEELDIEEKLRSRLIKQALDGMNRQYGLKEMFVESSKGAPKQKIISEGAYHFVKDSPKTITRRGHYSSKVETRRVRFNPKEITFSLGLFFIGMLLFLYSSRNKYLIFLVPFVPFPIPIWLVGIVLMGLSGLMFVGSFL